MARSPGQVQAPCHSARHDVHLMDCVLLVMFYDASSFMYGEHVYGVSSSRVTDDSSRR
jgi:hypothetical protein